MSSRSRKSSHGSNSPRLISLLMVLNDRIAEVSEYLLGQDSHATSKIDVIISAVELGPSRNHAKSEVQLKRAFLKVSEVKENKMSGYRAENESISALKMSVQNTSAQIKRKPNSVQKWCSWKLKAETGRPNADYRYNH